MSTRNSRRALVVLVALMLAVSGCVGADDSGEARPQGDAAQMDAGAPDDGRSGAAGQDAADAESAAIQQRLVIRTGEIRLEVEDFQTSQEALAQLARDNGGYVSDSSQRLNRKENATWTTGRIVVRVPQSEFESVFEAAKAEGTVLEAETSSEDVTDRIVDLEARLENLRAQRDRLRDLYEEANETSDVLRIERELSDVQAEIERTEAQLRALEDRVNYATITVHLAEPEPEIEREVVDPEPAWYETGVLSAFLSSVSGVVTLLRATVVAVAYVLPYVIVLGLPAVTLYAGQRWRSSGEESPGPREETK